MIGKAIYARLSTDAGVAAIVPTRAGGSKAIYPNTAPDELLPMIVYSVQQEDEDSLTSFAMKEFTVVITAAAATYAGAQQLAAAARASLDRQGGTWGGIPVRGFYLKGSAEDSYADGGNPENLIHTVEDTYRVWAIPSP